MDHIPRPKVVRLDPNDPGLIVGIPEEPEAREHETTSRDGKKVSCACDCHVTVMCSCDGCVTGMCWSCSNVVM